MKTLIVKENTRGKTAKIDAKRTYQKKFGEWIAEVDENEFNEACFDLCRDIEGCSCKDLRVEADRDDDGTQYTIQTS